jgi:hypothetical protein
MNQDEIIAANKLTADEHDWQKEQRRIEMGAEQKLRPAPHHPLYFPEESPRETRDKELQSIVEQNIKASQ